MRVLITLRPGANRDNLLKVLRSVSDDLHGLTSSHGRSAYKRLIDYLAWASRSCNLLRRQVNVSDLDQLVLTRRYELLLTGVGGLVGSEISDAVNDLVDLEVEERIEAFEEAIKALDEQIKRWSEPGVFVMPDSSFYIHHPDKVEEAQFAPLVTVWEDPIHVLVPVVVVDELDGLKQSKDKHVRYRARHTLQILDKAFGSSTSHARLRAEDFTPLNNGGIPRGEITVELLFDPPGHVRLPIADDEIIDRALAVEPLAARPVTLITYDTGQATRGRAAGLKVVKLDQEPEEEPALQNEQPKEKRPTPKQSSRLSPLPAATLASTPTDEKA